MHSRICQTSPATPAEPGGLLRGTSLDRKPVNLSPSEGLARDSLRRAVRGHTLPCVRSAGLHTRGKIACERCFVLAMVSTLADLLTIFPWIRRLVRRMPTSNPSRPSPVDLLEGFDDTCGPLRLANSRPNSLSIRLPQRPAECLSPSQPTEN